MPYVGSTAPAGWMLCDGSSIPSGDAYSALKTILGNATNVPDLRGMFIRGAGTNGVNTYVNNVGPSLRAIQVDGIVNHQHPFTSSSATTSSDGAHTHNFAGNAGGNQTLANGVSYDRNLGSGDEVYYPTMSSGAHTHTVTVSGTTNNQSSGLNETRPVNFGVNYIIKI
jgi:microcystin-dependent protein